MYVIIPPNVAGSSLKEVSEMCAAEVLQREGTKLASRQEFAKRVAMDLFRYMESFNKGVAGDMLVLPTNCLEQWFKKFDDKFRRNPDFLMQTGEKVPGS